MEQRPFPEKWQERMRTKWDAETVRKLVAGLQEPPEVSVRENPLKGKGLFAAHEPVPWAQDAYYLPLRPPFVLDPLHHAGAYYVQEASSMLFAAGVPWEEVHLALDLCAAPGGKSTLILDRLQPGSLLLSNELVSARGRALKENLIRWGRPNVVQTQNRVEDFAPLEGLFDLVVTDAPCSGEGMFRKDQEAVEQWSERLVESCAETQKDILTQALRLLKPGGILVFSTCTFETEENEANVEWLHQQEELEPVPIPIQPSWGVMEQEVQTQGGQQPVYYCLPGSVRGEGQFVSIMRKRGGNPGKVRLGSARMLERLSKVEQQTVEPFVQPELPLQLVKHKEGVLAVEKDWLPLVAQLLERLRVWKSGLEVGTLKKKSLVPSHELAMSSYFSPGLPTLELELEEALNYLQKNVLQPRSAFKGWGVAEYEGVPLGWLKHLGSRINNHYPQEYRIRIDVERWKEERLEDLLQVRSKAK